MGSAAGEGHCQGGHPCRRVGYCTLLSCQSSGTNQEDCHGPTIAYHYMTAWIALHERLTCFAGCIACGAAH